jgi:hypothetical protein
LEKASWKKAIIPRIASLWNIDPEFQGDYPTFEIRGSERVRMQRIWVFQQRGSGQGKIRAIGERSRGIVVERIISIDADLPPLLEDPSCYIPRDIDADLVLDFLKHPDLSLELAMVCKEKGIPVVASGKKIRIQGVITPPT